MEYIVHRPYHGLRMDCKQVDYEVGRTFPLIGFNICDGTVVICSNTSHVAQHYFAKNDDNRGLERGKLTWAIAFEPRQRIHSNGVISRFTEEEIAEIITNWSHLIEDNRDVILFNQKFFDGDIEELKRFASAINISVDNVGIFDDEEL